jgi:hypothetical protein
MQADATFGAYGQWLAKRHLPRNGGKESFAEPGKDKAPPSRDPSPRIGRAQA